LKFGQDLIRPLVHEDKGFYYAPLNRVFNFSVRRELGPRA